eukprot:TRINITY_DN24173_c0_g2_i1.p1 TRINITY_DN24173_c0_g2~~TRINITY_DN24173_c0_g2_i1.p1  ORF type:complete len:307 (-),score=69.56 TRINITY_DN24173_c0_g2_i1:162-1082(-)
MAVEVVPNEAGLNVIVKNTFLDLDESEDTGCAKRCSSVPRAWKPLSSTGSFSDGERASVSTNASDDELSEVSARSSRGDLVGVKTNGGSDGLEVVRPKAKLNPGAAEFTPCSPLTGPQAPMMPVPMLSPSFAPFGSPVMKVCAPPEAPPPMPAPSEEVTAVLSAAKSALLGNKHVADVKISPELCTPGTASTLNVELKPLGAKDQDAEKEVCCAGKAALIAACEHSQNTYVMGYEASPFKDMKSSGEPGFKATLSAVPDSMQELVCWEIYQKGTCRNQGMCQWYHPVPAHLLPIQLILRRPAPQNA